MQIVVGPVKQAAQSRCSLWRASQNTCWRWRSEQQASSHSSMWFYFSSVWAQWWIFLKHVGTTDRERERLKKVCKKPRLVGKRMLWAHGLVCHPDPRLFGCSPVWRIGLHLQQKGRVDSPLLQQLWERSLCGRCCQPRNEHKNCWARPVERRQCSQ